MVINPLKITIASLLIVTSPIISFANNNNQTNQQGFHNQPAATPNVNTRPHNQNNNNNPNKNWNKNNNNPNKNWDHNNNKNWNQNSNWDHEHHHNHTNTFIYYYDASPYYLYPGDDDSYYSTAPTDTTTTNTDSTQYSNPNQPYDVSTLPEGNWVSESNGNAPDKAFVFQMNNGSPLYYCRTQYKYTTYYGVLTPGSGCYIQDGPSLVNVNQYEVLVSTY